MSYHSFKLQYFLTTKLSRIVNVFQSTTIVCSFTVLLLLDKLCQTIFTKVIFIQLVNHSDSCSECPLLTPRSLQEICNPTVAILVRYKNSSLKHLKMN